MYPKCVGSRDDEDEGGDEDEAEGEHEDHAQLVPPLLRLQHVRHLFRKVDVRLPEKGNSNSHGARPVHLIITMI